MCTNSACQRVMSYDLHFCALTDWHASENCVHLDLNFFFFFLTFDTNDFCRVWIKQTCTGDVLHNCFYWKIFFLKVHIYFDQILSGFYVPCFLLHKDNALHCKEGFLATTTARKIYIIILTKYKKGENLQNTVQTLKMFFSAGYFMLFNF